MRVFMLGWEFPPFISGGLGTACYGLTRALSRQDTQIIFVLPKAIDTDHTSHVQLLSPQSPSAAHGDRSPEAVASRFEISTPDESQEFSQVTFRAVPSRMVSPYQSAGGQIQPPSVNSEHSQLFEGSPSPSATDPLAPSQADYSGDMLAETQRFAGLCVDLAQGEQFDVIHAHDWMTFPAGLSVARMTGKPLIVHVHSTEFDRSGENVYQPVYDIERRGMHGAIRVICVSYLTRSIVKHRYGINPDKIDVVYNGIDNDNDNDNGESRQEDYNRAVIKRNDKIVLFLGRITMQKGPEYFVHAAKRVLEKFDRVKFVMAGSGDKVRDVIELAAAEGIGHRVLFTGFLRGKDVERVFNMADVYVMPSVSEPFGIAPLEAIHHDVPVIISKTSGVAEVLTHALKVDFWNVNDIADKIVAVLTHPPLSTTLREHADIEVRRLTWSGAAAKCQDVYRRTVDLMPV